MGHNSCAVLPLQLARERDLKAKQIIIQEHKKKLQLARRYDRKDLRLNRRPQLFPDVPPLYRLHKSRREKSTEKAAET